MQSTVQQSSRHSFPAGASHGCGPVPSDHAHGDAAPPGKSGLQLPGAAAAQQSSGPDAGNRTSPVMRSIGSPQQTQACVSSRSSTRLITRAHLPLSVLLSKFCFKMFPRMRLNTAQTDLPEMSSCTALPRRINHLSFHRVRCYFIIPPLKDDNAGVARHFIFA